MHNKERKGNALFNDALNTFYLRLYGVGHMIDPWNSGVFGFLLKSFGIQPLTFVKEYTNTPGVGWAGSRFASRGALALDSTPNQLSC